jgi:HSP20 family protein
MLGMLFRSARNLSTRMYLLADDIGLIDVESLCSREIENVRWPQVDICETDESVIVALELPGVEKEDIEIASADDNLSVKAKRTAVSKRDESSQIRQQPYDLFERTIKLPCGVKSEQAKAALNNGLLTVTLPKETVAIRTRISIE